MPDASATDLLDPGHGARPRLAFVITEDWFFVSHFLHIARAAREAGFEVSVIARYGRYRDLIASHGLDPVDLPWRRGSLNPLDTLRTIAGLTAVLRELKPDIVHAIALKPIVAATLAGRLAGVGRLVCAVTGMGYLAVADGARARALRAAIRGVLRLGGRHPGTRFLVENQDHERELIDLGVAGSERIARVVGAGVDLSRFAPLPAPGGETVTVALVARMISIKGISVAVAAVHQLADAGVPIRLLLAGEPDEANPGALTRADLEAWARHPAVEWLGRVDDVPGLWARADVAVLPALGGDGLPKSLLEAAACGRPIVTTDTPGCREAVVPGETGLLVPPGDVDALAGALRELACDAGRRRRFGEAARRLAEARFAETAVSGRVLALYRDMLAQQGAGRCASCC